jgi:hypothetical protein
MKKLAKAYKKGVAKSNDVLHEVKPQRRGNVFLKNNFFCFGAYLDIDFVYGIYSPTKTLERYRLYSCNH